VVTEKLQNRSGKRHGEQGQNSKTSHGATGNNCECEKSKKANAKEQIAHKSRLSLTGSQKVSS